MKGWIQKWLLGGVIRRLVEGKYGPGPTRVYVALIGYKTWISAALCIIFGAAAYFGEMATGATLAQIAAIGVTLGVVDKAWRDPKAAASIFAETYHEILSFGPVVSALTALLVHFLSWLGWPSAQWAVVHINEAAIAIGGATAYLSASFARPPQIEEEDDE